MAKPSMAQNPRSRPLPSNSGVLSEKPSRANVQPTSNPIPSNSASKKPVRKKRCLRKAKIQEKENIKDVSNAPGEVDQRPQLESNSFAAATVPETYTSPDEALRQQDQWAGFIDSFDGFEAEMPDQPNSRFGSTVPETCPNSEQELSDCKPHDNKERQPLIRNFGVLTPNPNKLNIHPTLPNPTPEPSTTTLNEPTRKRKRLHRGRRRNTLTEQELSTELGGMEKETLGLSGAKVVQKTKVNNNLPLLGVKEKQEGEDHLLLSVKTTHEDEDYLLGVDDTQEDEANLLLRIEEMQEDAGYTSDFEEASSDAKASPWSEFDDELLESARVKIVEAGPRHDSRLANLIQSCLRTFKDEASSPIPYGIMARSFHGLVKRHSAQEFMDMFMWGIQKSVVTILTMISRSRCAGLRLDNGLRLGKRLASDRPASVRSASLEAVEKPVAEKPVAEKSLTEKPLAEKPLAKKPVAM
ncbi:hypothetical protein N7486_007558 [Penicillium sp. IBT 16267x]|nr:hypothetical protein N7486_007558 [Penicillium sp. IBT 16267x]